MGLPNHEFRLRRKLLNKEYKDEDETLQQCYLFDGSALLVEKVHSFPLPAHDRTGHDTLITEDIGPHS